ncbi:hypothetical protein V8E36_009221 [Tilletia maclaganii]
MQPHRSAIKSKFQDAATIWNAIATLTAAKRALAALWKKNTAVMALPLASISSSTPDASTALGTAQDSEIVALRMNLAASVEPANAKEWANAILSEKVAQSTGRDEEVKRLETENDEFQAQLTDAQREVGNLRQQLDEGDAFITASSTTVDVHDVSLPTKRAREASAALSTSQAEVRLPGAEHRAGPASFPRTCCLILLNQPQLRFV